MTESELKDRFRKFTIAVYTLTRKFPRETVYFVIEKQIIRSSSSSGANYNAACRAKSKPDFTNKLKIVAEELDESIYWLEYTNNIDASWKSHTENLISEANELLAIIVASIKTSQGNSIKNQKSKIKN